MHSLRLRSRLVIVAVTAAAALAILIPSATAAPVKVNVGAALTLTGPNAAYGLSSRRGIDLATKEINEGAVSGVKFNVKTIDDFGTAAGAAAAFGIFFRDNVSVLMGPTLSDVAMTVDYFAQAARIPVLGISNTQPGVSDIGTFIFRPALTEAVVLPAVVKAVATSSLMPKTAVVIQGSDAFAETSAPIFTTAITANGITVKKTIPVADGTTDFAAVAAEAKAEDPDVIAITALPAEGVPLLKALRNAGYKGKIMGSNAFASNVVTASAGVAANGLIVGTSWSAATKSRANEKFIKAFKKAYKRTPDQFAATAYAYTYVLAAAAKKAGSATQDAITAQLTAMTSGKAIPTLLGPFRFDAARNGVSPVTIQVVAQQKFSIFKPN
jgi:branched-chain amino acid transport system substrate-binding protein